MNESKKEIYLQKKSKTREVIKVNDSIMMNSYKLQLNPRDGILLLLKAGYKEDTADVSHLFVQLISEVTLSTSFSGTVCSEGISARDRRCDWFNMASNRQHLARKMYYTPS